MYWWRPSPSHVLFFSSDIKPENLLISSDDVLKLCDFGEQTYQTLTLWGLKERRQKSQSCDVKGVFSTEAIFGWNRCFRGAAARLHLLSKDCMQPSLLVLRLLVGSLPTFQLMKCVENQELHQALFQSGSTSTKHGEMKNKRCGQSVVRDRRPAVCSASVKHTPRWRFEGFSKESLKLKAKESQIRWADSVVFMQCRDWQHKLHIFSVHKQNASIVVH